jgi:hypothetical protein
MIIAAVKTFRQNPHIANDFGFARCQPAEYCFAVGLGVSPDLRRQWIAFADRREV